MSNKQKYLKYEQKYLNLMGGVEIYTPPRNLPYGNQQNRKLGFGFRLPREVTGRNFMNARNEKPVEIKDNTYYIGIDDTIPLFRLYKNELVRQLKDNGYIETNNQEFAAIVFLHDQPTYPHANKKTKELQSQIDEFKEVNKFRNADWVDTLYGQLKQIITVKVIFHEYFKEELKKYFVPWYKIRNDVNLINDINSIPIKEGDEYVLKASKSHSRKGTIIIKNRDQITDHIRLNSGIYTLNSDWLLENKINPNLIEGRECFYRVYIFAVYKEIDNQNQIDIYISNKHSCFISKDTDECRKNIINIKCIDPVEGNHLKQFGGSEGGGWAPLSITGESILYNLNKFPYWPKNVPDGYTLEDIKYVNEQLKEMFNIIFKDDELIKSLKPELGSTNGFEIFGVDFSLYKINDIINIALHEINARTGEVTFAPFINQIIEIIKTIKTKNVNLEDFTLLKKLKFKTYSKQGWKKFLENLNSKINSKLGLVK